MKLYLVIAAIALLKGASCQDNIHSICTFCGDAVNEYCCQYYNSCCDFITPSGCPPPTSPETRKACRNPIRCTSTSQCPARMLCCRTSLCGTTCTDLIFAGYNH